MTDAAQDGADPARPASPAPGHGYPPPPAFDDDALAAALQASYTQPVTVVPPVPPAGPVPPADAASPVDAAPPAPAAPPPPGFPAPPSAFPPPPVPPAPAAVAPAAPAASAPAPPVAPPSEPQPAAPAYEPDYVAPDVPQYAPAPAEPDVPQYAPPAPPAWEPPPAPAPPLVEPPASAPVEPGFPPAVPSTAPVPPDTPVPPGAPVPPAAPPPPAPPPSEPPAYAPSDALPPQREVRLEDVQGLPPPVGQQAAPLPPYVPDAADVVPPQAAPVPPPPPPLWEPPQEPSPAAPLGGPPAPRPLPGADTLPSLDDDDVVDDIDRAFGAQIPDPGFGPPPYPGSPVADTPVPSGPIATTRVTGRQPGLVDHRPENHPVFVVEHAGTEPTAEDLRAGRASRLFWLWFATNSSVVSLAVGAVLFTSGISLRQAIVATLAGVALSFLPLGLGTLAGKWSGQPTMVVSRATFGHIGNILPAVLGILTRVFWGAVLLWILAVASGRLLVFAGLDADLGETVWTYVILGIALVVAAVIALFGYGFVARLQLVATILSGILVAGLIVLTYPRVDLDAALAVGDGAWTVALGGAVLVFSFVGLAWVQSSSDVARYQRPASSGAQSMLWASLGATIPPFVLIVWGALLAASDPDQATGLADAPLQAVARMLPLWYPAPVLAAAGLGLLCSVVLAIYSGGFAVQAAGLKARRSATTAVSALLVGAVAAGLTILDADAFEIARDLATTLAVPVAAWAGIFGAEMMIRTRRFDTASLVAPGGVYPRVRVVNLVGLVLITALGFGLTSATFPGLTWQGYLFPLVGIPLEDPFARSDVGVVVALMLGIVLALATAIPTIRNQERESLRLEHTGPVPRTTGGLPRSTGPAPVVLPVPETTAPEAFAPEAFSPPDAVAAEEPPAPDPFAELFGAPTVPPAPEIPPAPEVPPYAPPPVPPASPAPPAPPAGPETAPGAWPPAGDLPPPRLEP